MSDLMSEIYYHVDRFREIDRQIAKVKLTKAYKAWHKRPVPSGQRTDSYTFSVTLWKGTDIEQKIVQTITKHNGQKIKPLLGYLAKRLREIESLERLTIE